MNCNEFVYGNIRGRNKNTRGRGVRAINIQRPIINRIRNASTRKTTSTKFGSSISSIKWKNQSRLSNNLTYTVTKSNSSRTCTSSDSDSRVIVAISHGRGEATCEIGLAAIDICKPSLTLCQISDTPSYINTLTKINILDPVEVLLPITFVDTPNSNRLVDKIKEHFKNITITAVPRLTYNKSIGLDFIKELCASQWDSILLVLEYKYYCLTAAAALLTYTESILYVIYNKKSLKVEYQESEGYCIIDVSTADKLELVASNLEESNERYSSLYGILNYCSTKIGARTLRATILQPPCSVPDIEARWNCIDELKMNSNMMVAVQAILPKISNIDQLLSLATLPSDQGDNFSERHLTYVLTLKALLDYLEHLRDIFEDSQQPFFKEFRATLRNDFFIELTEAMRLLIQPDARPAKGQQGITEKCFIIKPGVNGLLDVLRRTYSERVEDLKDYVNQLRDKYNLPLTLHNNSKKGYHIVLQLNGHMKKIFKISELPDEFIQVDRLFSSVTMKTTNLMNLAIRIEDILQEILKISSVMVYQLLIKVRNHIGLFYKLCEDIAKLDVIQSLAQASNGIGYTRPEFGEYLEITNSRHPLLDFLCSTEPTPNSIFASRDHNIHIITGPNGSGKSIFIRQTFLLQIMAQVGCFVPAEKATLRVCDRMLARVYFEDNMDCGASAFVLEVKEIQYFHTVMTSNTLIIIDELCRSTAVGEGTALAMAITESLAKSQAFVFLATHYIFVTKLEEFYPGVTNWQMETTEEVKERIILHFTYKLKPGITTVKKYGLRAAVASWPQDVVESAEGLYNKIEPLKYHAKIRGLNVLDHLKFNLEAELKMLKMKKILTTDSLQERLLCYAENLKNIGIDITQYMPQSGFENHSSINIAGNSEILNLTWSNTNPRETVGESLNSSNISHTLLYPQVIYSPSVANTENNLVNYDQFCQEIEAKNPEYPEYNVITAENTSFNCYTEENNANMSRIVSQNINRIVADNRQNRNNVDLQIPNQNKHFLDVSSISQIVQNEDSLSKTNKVNSNSIPWVSPSILSSHAFLNSKHQNYTPNNTSTYRDCIDGITTSNVAMSKESFEDSDVTTAINDLQECSVYFTQEWEDLNEDIISVSQQQGNKENEESYKQLPKTPTKVCDKNDLMKLGTNSNVVIHSVHIFDQNNELVGIQEFHRQKENFEGTECSRNDQNQLSNDIKNEFTQSQGTFTNTFEEYKAKFIGKEQHECFSPPVSFSDNFLEGEVTPNQETPSNNKLSPLIFKNGENTRLQDDKFHERLEKANISSKNQFSRVEPLNSSEEFFKIQMQQDLSKIIKAKGNGDVFELNNTNISKKSETFINSNNSWFASENSVRNVTPFRPNLNLMGNPQITASSLMQENTPVCNINSWLSTGDKGNFNFKLFGNDSQKDLRFLKHSEQFSDNKNVRIAIENFEVSSTQKSRIFNFTNNNNSISANDSCFPITDGVENMQETSDNSNKKDRSHKVETKYQKSLCNKFFEQQARKYADRLRQNQDSKRAHQYKNGTSDEENYISIGNFEVSSAQKSRIFNFTNNNNSISANDTWLQITDGVENMQETSDNSNKKNRSHNVETKYQKSLCNKFFEQQARKYADRLQQNQDSKRAHQYKNGTSDEENYFSTTSITNQTPPLEIGTEFFIRSQKEKFEFRPSHQSLRREDVTETSFCGNKSLENGKYSISNEENVKKVENDVRISPKSNDTIKFNNSPENIFVLPLSSNKSSVTSNDRSFKKEKHDLNLFNIKERKNITINQTCNNMEEGVKLQSNIQDFNEPENIIDEVGDASEQSMEDAKLCQEIENIQKSHNSVNSSKNSPQLRSSAKINETFSDKELGQRVCSCASTLILNNDLVIEKQSRNLPKTDTTHTSQQTYKIDEEFKKSGCKSLKGRKFNAIKKGGNSIVDQNKVESGTIDANQITTGDYEIEKSVYSYTSNLILNNKHLSKLQKRNLVESDASQSPQFKDSMKTLNRYFGKIKCDTASNQSISKPNIKENIAPENKTSNKLNQTTMIQAKTVNLIGSTCRNIFETSCMSESLFGSSPEDFFSAADETPKPSTSKKPEVKKRKAPNSSLDEFQVMTTKSTRKFKTPLKTAGNEGTSVKKIKRKILVKKPSLSAKFVPPKRLSKREILEDFEKQKKKILEDSDDPDKIEKYIKFIENRPNVEQLQAQKYIAVIKKTDDGVVVIPASNPTTKTRKEKPLKRKLSVTDFSKTMLSDKNENKLKTLLETDERIFNFDDEHKNNVFNICGSPKKDLNFQVDQTQKNDTQKSFTLNLHNSKMSLNTQQGYYTQNQNVIDTIMKKYL